MYVTATSPYIFMLVLLIRNSLLEGAKEGIIYYIKPDFTKMQNTQVWFFVQIKNITVKCLKMKEHFLHVNIP